MVKCLQLNSRASSLVGSHSTPYFPSVPSLRIRLRLVISVAAVGCAYPASRHLGQTQPAITQSDLGARLSVFSDDSMLGRSALNAGHERAVKYLAAEIKRIGLVPGGDKGTYFQTFLISDRRLNPASILIVQDSILHPTADFKAFSFGRGQPRPISGAQVIFGGVVGDTLSQINASQATRRVVLLGLPSDMTAERVYANVVYGPHSRFRDAAAVAIASLDYLPANQRAITSSIGLADSAELPASGHPTSILVSRRAANLLLGRDAEHAETGTLGRTVTGRLMIDEINHPARNVIGILGGNDSALRKEYVALGAHSDHLGVTVAPLEHDSVRAYNIERRRREREASDPTRTIVVNVDSLRKIRPARSDSIYNGADDDGSGSVALLEIAERFATPTDRPRRSLLFVWHAAEEMGLIGSGWFTNHPTVPLDSIVAQLNLDMVGRGTETDLPGGGPRYLEVIGASRRSAVLHDIVKEVNSASKNSFSIVTSDPNGLFCRSDHWNYARFGIPIAFFTTGLHADYHQITDEAQYIDYEKLERVTRFVAEVARTLANSGQRFEPPGRRPTFALCSG